MEGSESGGVTVDMYKIDDYSTVIGGNGSGSCGLLGMC
jgi:ABC-type uncharacterized transport system ATPase component